MKKIHKMKKQLGRVDVQVSIFTACVVIISSMSILLFSYSITYADMINSLRERVYSIYNYLNKEMDKSTFFDINTKDDINKESYKHAKQMFHNVKNATGVQYLYTAKKNENNEYIYILDGLPDSANDFRYPGDLIEPEIINDLSRALAGEEVLPNDIVNTAWGDIFITYMPMYDKDGNVKGAIGIEFNAEHQYITYRILRIATPIIILITCIISALFAVYYFRRVSNPRFQDLANTDYLTQLKNRNSYELDVKNMCAMQTAINTGLILADLNGLKIINDTNGHEAGDLYIKTMAEALKNSAKNNEILYRVGGDEFAIIIKNSSDEYMNEFIEKVNVEFIKQINDRIPNASCSFGKSVCKGNTISCFEKAYHEADLNMYENKKRFYNKTKS